MSYLNGYPDREFIEELPRFRLPMLSGGGTYRAFEINDDSMLPSVGRGTTVVGRYVENWKTIKGGTPCIVVSTSGIEFRRLHPLTDGFCLLHDNPVSAPKSERMGTTAFEDILEIWEAKSYISSTFPLTAPSLENLSDMVLDLTRQVKDMLSQRA